MQGWVKAARECGSQQQWLHDSSAVQARADPEGGVGGPNQGPWGRKYPSGVQGQSPGRGSGGQSPPEAGAF